MSDILERAKEARDQMYMEECVSADFCAKIAKILPELIAECENIRLEQAAKIAELEGWLIEERAKCIYGGLLSPTFEKWYAEIAEDGLGPNHAELESMARESLAGKIGSSDHIPDATKMILTKEQRGALQTSMVLIGHAISNNESSDHPENTILETAGLRSDYAIVGNMLASSQEATTRPTGLTNKQRAAIQRVIDYMNHMYPISSPYFGCTDDVACLRALLASPPAWEATAERQEALRVVLKETERMPVSYGSPVAKVEDAEAMLRAMLGEVEGK